MKAYRGICMMLSLSASLSWAADRTVILGSDIRGAFYCNSAVLGDLVDSLIRYRNYLLRTTVAKDRVQEAYASEGAHLSTRFGAFHSKECAYKEGHPVKYSVDLRDSRNEYHDSEVDPSKELWISYRPYDVKNKRCLPELKVRLVNVIPPSKDSPKKLVVSEVLIDSKGNRVSVACPGRAFSEADASVTQFFDDGKNIPQDLFARKVDAEAIDFSRAISYGAEEVIH